TEVVAFDILEIRKQTPNARWILARAWRDMGGKERIDLAALQHRVEPLFGGELMDGHVRGRIKRRPIGSRPAALEPTYEMLHAARFDTEIIAERTLGPDSRVMAIALQFADPAAGEIGGRLNPLPCIHKDCRVSKEAVGKNGNRDKWRV